MSRIIRGADFFSGTHSFTKPYSSDEAIFYTVDNNPEYKETTTAIKDFTEVTPEEVLEHVGGPLDVLYIGFPCTTFSVASMWTHWTGGARGYIPATLQAEQALRMLDHLVFNMIPALKPKYIFFENPRGMMRKMPQVQIFDRVTIWHC